MQKREKISPSRSSAVNSPVIAQRACWASRSSSANNSQRSCLPRRRGEVFAGLTEGAEMAFARNEQGLTRLLPTGRPEQLGAQQVYTGARLGRNQNFIGRIAVVYAGLEVHQVDLVPHMDLSDGLRQTRGGFSRSSAVSAPEGSITINTDRPARAPAKCARCRCARPRRPLRAGPPCRLCSTARHRSQSFRGLRRGSYPAPQ